MTPHLAKTHRGHDSYRTILRLDRQFSPTLPRNDELHSTLEQDKLQCSSAKNTIIFSSNLNHLTWEWFTVHVSTLPVPGGPCVQCAGENSAAANASS